MIRLFEKIFTKTNMTWKLVVLTALVCGAVSGLLMIPEVLKNTSLQQPGISYEFWIFAAMFVILNCKRPVEAGLKTIVFFAISQPLVYLVQAPVAGFGLFRYYPFWAILTIFTLPAGMFAWFGKKGNWLSLLVVSVVNAVLCIELAYFIPNTILDFPHLLITNIFIVFQILLFTLMLLQRVRLRIIAFVIAAALVAFGFAYQASRPGFFTVAEQSVSEKMCKISISNVENVEKKWKTTIYCACLKQQENIW